MHSDILSRTAISPDDVAQQQARRSRSARATFLLWLRKIHLYVGLWGAVLGLLFGATGLLMNHRAILKIPVQKTVQKSVQLATPPGNFANPEQMSDWLQSELKFKPATAPVIKKQPVKKVLWGEREVMQPERWTVNLQNPGKAINAEYFVGNRFVQLEQQDATPIGTLMRLHTATGVNAFWVLLSDTIAGCFMLLSLTGLLLWTQLHTVRSVAVMTGVGGLLSATWLFWAM